MVSRVGVVGDGAGVSRHPVHDTPPEAKRDEVDQGEEHEHGKVLHVHPLHHRLLDAQRLQLPLGNAGACFDLELVAVEGSRSGSARQVYEEVPPRPLSLHVVQYFLRFGQTHAPRLEHNRSQPAAPRLRWDDDHGLAVLVSRLDPVHARGEGGGGSRLRDGENLGGARIAVPNDGGQLRTEVGLGRIHRMHHARDRSSVGLQMQVRGRTGARGRGLQVGSQNLVPGKQPRVVQSNDVVHCHLCV
mmetsp:Transcript_24451/g.61485  ORF Transcript_24451/g.61485 Transcript_24451/m.61485 type:complete len:244 (+) Transcript_24451:1311-2042(+)